MQRELIFEATKIDINWQPVYRTSDKLNHHETISRRYV